MASSLPEGGFFFALMKNRLSRLRCRPCKCEEEEKAGRRYSASRKNPQKFLDFVLDQSYQIC